MFLTLKKIFSLKMPRRVHHVHTRFDHSTRGSTVNTQKKTEWYGGPRPEWCGATLGTRAREGLGLRGWGFGFKVWGLGFKVWGSGFGVQGVGLMIHGLWFMVYGLGSRGYGLGYEV